MSVPPAGGWPPPQDLGSGSNQGKPYGHQFNPQGHNPQQPPPPGWQQAGPPPQHGAGLKWLLIAVAVLLVIGISVGATLIFTRGDSGGGTSTAASGSGAPSDFASAGDTGPIAIIVDEPTCNTFNGINNGLADIQSKGWGAERASLGPAAQWTPEQRTQAQSVATAMRNAADQAVALAKQTPHRLVRELYEQFIGYGQAYADSVQSYSPPDDGFASANISAGSAVVGICNAINSASASRSLSLAPMGAPTGVAPPAPDPRNTRRFISAGNAPCAEWKQVSNSFDVGTTEWQQLDTGIPGSEWTVERQALERAAIPFLQTWASDMERIGRDSANPVFEDFAVAAALYTRAYLAVGEDYTGADSWLNYTAYRLNNVILGGCTAVGG